QDRQDLPQDGHRRRGPRGARPAVEEPAPLPRPADRRRLERPQGRAAARVVGAGGECRFEREPAEPTGRDGRRPDRPAAQPAPGPPPPPPPTPPAPGRPRPAGFRPRTEAGVPASGWPNQIVSDRDGATMVFIPAGAFLQGRDDGPPEEAPEHRVTLGPFYIDQ